MISTKPKMSKSISFAQMPDSNRFIAKLMYARHAEGQTRGHSPSQQRADPSSQAHQC